METFKYCWVWEKSKASDFINANYRPMKKHEDIAVFSLGGAAPGCKNRMVYNPQGIIEKENVRVRSGSLGIGRDRESQQGEYTSKGTNYPTSIISIKSIGKTVHPTQKPVALMSYLIRTYTNPNDTVLDFAMGSGSTGVACIQENRNFIGIELLQEYVDIAEERIEQEVKRMRQLEMFE